MIAQNEVFSIPISDIVINDDVNPRNTAYRENYEPEVILQYRDMLKAGSEAPPILIDQHNVLLDGAHRYAAAKEEGRETIRARRVTCDDYKQQLIQALIPNTRHGKKLRKSDLTKAFKRLRKEGVTTKEIAEVMGFSRSYVDGCIAADARKVAREYLGTPVGERPMVSQFAAYNHVDGDKLSTQISRLSKGEQYDALLMDCTDHARSRSAYFYRTTSFPQILAYQDKAMMLEVLHPEVPARRSMQKGVESLRQIGVTAHPVRNIEQFDKLLDEITK